MKSKSKQSSNKVSLFINYPNFQVNIRKQKDSTIDWSSNTPSTISPPHIPLAGHVSLPYVSLPQGSSSSNNILEMSSFRLGLLNYGNGQPTDVSSWNGAF